VIQMIAGQMVAQPVWGAQSRFLCRLPDI